jgi:hypothetical protein
VRIPFAAASASVKELDETNSALDEFARDEAALAEGFGLRISRP